MLEKIFPIKVNLIYDRSGFKNHQKSIKSLVDDKRYDQAEIYGIIPVKIRRSIMIEFGKQKSEVKIPLPSTRW